MASSIGSVHADFMRRMIQWKRIRNALEGTDEIKEEGENYLPKPDGMSQDAYDAYKRRAHFFPVAERTLRGMSGIVFRIEAKFVLPTRMEPMRECVTTDGNSLALLTETVVNEVLSVGRYGILVDYPEGNTSSTDLPYLATYTAENIVDWRIQLVNGLRTVTRLVLRDDIDEDDEDDEQIASEQRLELILNEDGQYEIRRWVAAGIVKSTKGKNDTTAWVMRSTTVPTVNGKPLNKIPFVFINPYDLRPEVEKPPMLDLVDTNLALYRNSADYEHALYLTSQPTPWVSGAINEDNKPKAIGSGAFWILPEGSQAGMLEFKGQGIQAMQQAMNDKKQDLAALGARMIHEGQNRNEAADTARMRGKGELSLLTNVVNMADEGIERALRIAAEWVGANPDEVEVTMNRDWIEARMNGTDLTALVKAWQAGAMSHQTLYENLQRGEIAQPDREFEEEQQLIEDEGGGMNGAGAPSIAQILAAAGATPPGAPQPGGTGSQTGEGGSQQTTPPATEAAAGTGGR